MTTLPLHLEYSAAPTLPAKAWLISGNDPERWLREIIGWKLEQRRLRLFILPVSAENPAATGVLVTTTEPQPAPEQIPAALPYGELAEGCYAPVQSRLVPAVSAQELHALKDGGVLVLHPALGPIRFESGDALRLHDLLAAGPERKASWKLPPVEEVPHDRIESVSIRIELQLKDLFGSEQQEIGSEPAENLPPADGEPGTSAAARGWRKLRGWLSGSKAQPGGIFDQVEQWVSKNFQGASRDLARMQGLALARLLEQLRTHPEEGLKYALPLGARGGHRGATPPSGRLGARSTDFSLGRLRRGGPAEFWHVPPDLHQQLRQQYLQLAERERHLGRHKRAAYIHAELLGDLTSAARMLVEGEHWHEAAVLYRDHLRQPLLAADCFIKARMVADAIVLYERENAYEPLGELHCRLGNETAAAAAFRQWVAQLIATGRLLQAADVLEHRLQDRAEALHLLESAWPGTPEAKLAVEKRLAMHAAAGEHDAAVAFIRRAANAIAAERHVTQYLEIAAGAQKTYPDRGVRQAAEDQGRVIIARCLALPEGKPLRMEALRHLPALAPDDLLLARDARRHLDRLRAKREQSPAPKRLPETVAPKGVHPARLELIREIQLPMMRPVCLKAAATTNGFCAVGLDRTGVNLTRCAFEMDRPAAYRNVIQVPGPSAADVLLCCAPGEPEERIFLAIANAAPAPEAAFGAWDDLPPVRIGAPPWLSEPVAAAAFGADRTLWALRTTASGATITGFYSNGTIAASMAAPAVPAVHDEPGGAAVTPRTHLAVIGQDIVCAVGSALYRCDANGFTLLADFGAAILSLEPSPPWGAPHVAVTLESCIAFCWLGVHQGRVHVVERDLQGASVGFTSDRLLAAITRSSGFLLDCDSRGRLRSAHFEWKGAAPVAVLRGPAARTFTVVDCDGFARIFGFSPSDLK